MRGAEQRHRLRVVRPQGVGQRRVLPRLGPQQAVAHLVKQRLQHAAHAEAGGVLGAPGMGRVRCALSVAEMWEIAASPGAGWTALTTYLACGVGWNRAALWSCILIPGSQGMNASPCRFHSGRVPAPAAC